MRDDGPWPTFLRVLQVNGALAAGAWAVGVAAFVLQAGGIAHRFAALATGPYVSVAIGAQLATLPAYLVLGLLLAALVTPWAGARRGLGFGARVVALDVLVLVVALGPALLVSPGHFDTVARKTRLDVYLLQRLHGLELMAVGCALLGVVAFGFFVRSTRRRSLAAVGAVALGTIALREPTPPRATPLGRPNVLVIAADSWRFDRLGAHGTARPGLTPHLDAFASTAVDFRQHHVATASTLESWATMLSGQFPWTHGLRSMYPSKAEVAAVESNGALLPRQLAALGYDTFVSSDWVGNCFDLVDFGFGARRVSPVQNFPALLLEATARAHPVVPLFFGALPPPLGDWLVPGRASLASAARPQVLTEQLFGDIDASLTAKRPFFGVLFVSPTHLPYNARAPFNAKYTAPGYDGPHRYQVEVRAHELITTGFSPTLAPETMQHVRDLYDGAVSDFDDTVGEVLRGLEVRGLAGETIVIVTSDHGEDLYDPGSTLGHGTNFFGGDQSTRIPFLVRIPGVSPRTVDAITRSVDLAPTLLAHLGTPIPSSMEGVSLMPLLSGARGDLGLMAFAETCYLFFPKSRAMTGLTEAERAEVVEVAGAEETLTVDPDFRDNLVLRPALRQAVIDAKDRMVRTRTHKLVVIPGRQREIVRLYDVVADPAQRVNLAGRGLAIEAELRAALPGSR
ncbi:MAG: sulfatase [Myxococcaceae bacterium]|nr:sulfatase [Myxococcaceae bacterium]